MSHDAVRKFNIYEKHRIREYWIVYPEGKYVTVFNLESDQRYGRPENYAAGMTPRSKVPDGLEIDLVPLFGKPQDEEKPKSSERQAPH